MVINEMHGKAGDFGFPSFKLLTQDCFSSMAVVNHTEDPSATPTPSPPSQPPAFAGRPAQSAEAGGGFLPGLPWEPTAMQDFNGLAASLHRHTRAEKESQKSKMSSLCEMRLHLNIEA